MQNLESPRYCTPQQVFKLKLTWVLYEATRFILAWLLILITLALVGGLLLINPVYWFIVEAALPYLLIGGESFLNFYRYRLISRHRLFLAQIMSDVNPGVNPQKWDEVTFKLNEILYKKRLWKTPYCIFKREICQDMFRRFLLRPVCKNSPQHEGSALLDDTIYCMEPCVANYKYALEDHFAGLLREKLPEPSEDNLMLPRDVFQTRFNWAQCTFFYKKLSLIIWVSNIFFFLLGLQSSWFCLLLLGSCMPLPIFWGYFSLECSKLGLSERLWFLAFFIRVAPGSNMEKYDQIARYMNQHLRSNEIWKNPDEYFFDGVDCIHFFKKHFMPLVSNNDGTKGVEYDEMQSIVEEASKNFDVDLS